MLTTINQDAVDVNTGEVKTGSKETVLYSSAIGSCVVVVLFDVIGHLGGMAHVMLPGEAPVNEIEHPTKYARNGIEILLNQMLQEGADQKQIIAFLVGGGNVLMRKDDTICQENLKSVEHILLEKGIQIKARATGGLVRRTVLFNVRDGAVYFTEGDSNRMQLYKNHIQVK